MSKKEEVLRKFRDTMAKALRKLGGHEVSEKLNVMPGVARRWAEGTERPHKSVQQNAIDTLSPLL